MITAANLAQIKQALKTKKVKALLTLGLAFVLGVYVILSTAFASIKENLFEEYFWVLALLEILLAGIAVLICARVGNLNALKSHGPVRAVMQKLFRH